METPVIVNLIIKRDNDFNESFEFIQDDGSPMDLTGWTIKSDIRKGPSKLSELIVSFTLSIPLPTNGKVYLSLTDTQTGAMIGFNTAYYDILLTSPTGFDETYVEGSITINSSITVKV